MILLTNKCHRLVIGSKYFYISEKQDWKYGTLGSFQLYVNVLYI